MTRSVRWMLGAILVLVMGLVAAPAVAAPPEPYRVATGLEGGTSAAHVAIGDRIFWVNHGSSGTSSNDSELWTSDGTSEGTHEFFDPNPGGRGLVGSLLKFGSGFVFTATGPAGGAEVWYSDGTTEGTEMIADLTVDDAGSTWLLEAGPGAVYLAADDGAHGRELYRWTGPGAAPQLLDVNPTARMTSDEELQDQWRTDWTDSSPVALGMVGDAFVFTADQTIRTADVSEWGDHYVATSGTGRELWRVGPTGPPQLVKDISQTDAWGDPSPQESTPFAERTGTAVMGGSLYFLLDSTEPGVAEPEMWRTNGVSEGTVKVAHLPLAYLDDQWDFEPAVAGGRLFYRAWSGDWDGMWATDGTGAGQRVSPAGDATDPVTLGSGVVFGLEQDDTGREPWFSGGTSSVRLGDLRAGAAGAHPFPITTWGSHAYFGANGGSGRDLYRTDGTPAGTERVMDLPNAAGAVLDGPMVFYGAEGLLYFVNSPDDDRNVGNELWAFDPNRAVTATSTVLRAPATVAYGAAATVTIAVTGAGGPPTGTVTIRDGQRVLGTAELANGAATFALPRNLALGDHVLTATYSGDAQFSSSTSAPVTVRVKAATRLGGRVNDLTFLTTERIRVTATLRTTPAINATGRLQLLVDGRVRATATLAARHRNTLTLVSPPLARGRHRLQVVFSQSPNAMDARTGVVTITVYR
ncbi:Ig-like domain repeat protein [Aeromicrobium sp. Marseille-Q0843]|uniref:Ig-like domain repeat protein n=1 Tax=Aeromicrobium phoceense TaxID=2754045 RepID=A0A838X867_9ACTN|nr:Ig-like domain repeat protein [Aeromicrobium phoceense]MBA4607699.1 Ig-like domain repeat protein [Aeromicrobium phoceense]